jgi:hypothetical protein
MRTEPRQTPLKTYEDALTWLASIGGQLSAPKQAAQQLDSVTVGLPGQGLERTGHFDSALEGAARKHAYEEAVRTACEEFRLAGAEELSRR